MGEEEENQNPKTTTHHLLPQTPTKLPSRPKKTRKLNPSNPSLPHTIINPLRNHKIPPPSPIIRSQSHTTNPKPPLSNSPFLSLTKSILYQQLSSKAGSSIYNKLVSLCNGESSVLPETVMNLSTHQLRQIGISGRKASYLHDLAEKFRDGSLRDESILGMDQINCISNLGACTWSQ